MFPSFLLSLREGLEATLIVGIVIASLYKIRRPELMPNVWWGVGIALLVSIFAAITLTQFGAEFEGRAEGIFEGTAMFLAAGILTWMIFWMRANAQTLRQEIENDVRYAARYRGRRALFMLAFLAIVREGLELVLFLIAAKISSNTWQTLVGAFLGLGTAIIIGLLFFKSTRRMSLTGFFQVTNLLLIFFAAGLVAHSVHQFNEAGLIPAVIEHIWDINHILDENSTPGQIAKALFGYNGDPSLTEIIAYMAFFVLIGLGARLDILKRFALWQAD